ncbi:Protein CLEC-62 b [Aphelenchoides avenae]|nr:Protein CLEC-62 b [Aphelenchus avenae]
MKLMTVAMVRNDESPDEVESIGALASDGYAFHTDADKAADASTLVADIQSAFCRANCFCPNGWFQFADSFSKPKTRFAECVRFSSSPANWYGAKASCAMQAGGQAFMASELSKLKHDFHADYVRSIKVTVVHYLIGMTYESDVGQYQWDQTYSNGTHYSVRPNDYQPWFKDEGTDNLRAAVQVGSRGSDTYWFKVEKTSNNNQYMCQVDACDTDHYCDGGNAVNDNDNRHSFIYNIGGNDKTLNTVDHGHGNDDYH